MTSTTIDVCIIYQTDPLGTIPGGIDTFIRGILGWAPEDISMNVIGLSTDPVARPVGKWSKCSLRGNSFNFLPLFALADQGKQQKIPLSVQLCVRLLANKPGRNIDVLEFHRIEPGLALLADRRPKNLVVHQNMSVINDSQSDIRWKYFPGLYFKIEKFLLSRISSVFGVREDAVADYQKRYPEMADKFNFIPTWMDPEIFHSLPEEEQTDLKKKLIAKYGLSPDDKLLISVGRLDYQKDPLLMIDAFKEVQKFHLNTRLIWVGDGVLRERTEKYVKENGLQEKVLLVGLQSPSEVANLLRGSDVFVLSSAYEGMPMCVLEALGCGLPVATTEVGEVKRVVLPGKNGEIASTRNSESLARAIIKCLENLVSYSGAPCVTIASEYVPGKVLKPFYENYRKLARSIN